MAAWETAARKVLRSGQPTAELILRALDEVNPTGLRLARAEEDARYAVKAQLQSLLIRLFPELLTVEPAEPHPLLRCGRRDAKHVFVSALDADAAVWFKARLADAEEAASRAGASRTEAVDEPERPAGPKVARRAEIFEEDGDYDQAIEAWLEERGAAAVARAVELALDWLDDPERAGQILAKHGDRLPEEARRRAIAQVAVRQGRFEEALSVLDPAYDHDVWAELGRLAWRAGEARVAARALRAAVAGASTTALTGLLAEVEAALDREVQPWLADLSGGDVEALRRALAAVEAIDAQHPAAVEGRRRLRAMSAAAEQAAAEALARAQVEVREVAQREAWRSRARTLAAQAFDAGWVAAWLELPASFRGSAGPPAALAAWVEATGEPDGPARGWCADAARFVSAEAALVDGDGEAAEALFLVMDPRHARRVRPRVEVATGLADRARQARQEAWLRRARAALAAGEHDDPVWAEVVEGEQAAALRRERLEREEATRNEAWNESLVAKDPAAYLRRPERDPVRVARALRALRAELTWWSWPISEDSPRTAQAMVGARGGGPARLVLPDGRFVSVGHAGDFVVVVVRDPDGRARRAHLLWGASTHAALVGVELWLATATRLVALDLDVNEPRAVIELPGQLAEGAYVTGLSPWGRDVWIRTERRDGERSTPRLALFDLDARTLARKTRTVRALYGGPENGVAVREDVHLVQRVDADGAVDGSGFLGEGVPVRHAAPMGGRGEPWLIVGDEGSPPTVRLYQTRWRVMSVKTPVAFDTGQAPGGRPTVCWVDGRALLFWSNDTHVQGWWLQPDGATWRGTPFTSLVAGYAAIARQDGTDVRLVRSDGRSVRVVRPQDLPESLTDEHLEHDHGLDVSFQCLMTHDDEGEAGNQRIRDLGPRLNDQDQPEFSPEEIASMSALETLVVASHFCRVGRPAEALRLADLVDQRSPKALTRRHNLHLRALALAGLGRLDEAEEALGHLEVNLRRMSGGRPCDAASLRGWIDVLRGSDPDGPDRTGGDPNKRAWRKLRGTLAAALRASHQGDHATALDLAAQVGCGRPFARAIGLWVALRAPEATLEQRLWFVARSNLLFDPGEVVPGLEVPVSRRELVLERGRWILAFVAFLKGEREAPVGGWGREGGWKSWNGWGQR